MRGRTVVSALVLVGGLAAIPVGVVASGAASPAAAALKHYPRGHAKSCRSGYQGKTWRHIAGKRPHRHTARFVMCVEIPPHDPPTVVTVTSSANPAVVGDTVTYTITVDHVLSSTTGKLQLWDGTTQLSTCSLPKTPTSPNANGEISGTCSETVSSAGTLDIVGVFTGDSTYAQAAGTLTETVDATAPTTTSGTSGTVAPATLSGGGGSASLSGTSGGSTTTTSTTTTVPSALASTLTESMSAPTNCSSVQTSISSGTPYYQDACTYTATLNLSDANGAITNTALTLNFYGASGTLVAAPTVTTDSSGAASCTFTISQPLTSSGGNIDPTTTHDNYPWAQATNVSCGAMNFTNGTDELGLGIPESSGGPQWDVVTKFAGSAQDQASVSGSQAVTAFP